MAYTVKIEKRALKTLDKMDPPTRTLILSWVNKNLEGCKNPRALGHSLTGPRDDQWRYRIGDWRLLAHINDKEIGIYIFKIGNRKDVYRRK
ncbi:MAG: type II toxin-antitoxin system RelE/ParE family toxin [Coriobacteriia bacterium]|nr:type II toxin-antitoxin system RelE/ParE family toxin [Coriobacteriia bacterium]